MTEQSTLIFTSSSPLHILLIEDNPGDARLIREMLLSSGTRYSADEFELDLAETLHDGLNLLRAENYEYDLILLDLSLPDSSGLDTILKVRVQAPSLAIIVLTGFDNQSIGVRAVRSGAQDYLVKDDVDSRLLQRAITYAIERHRIEEALRRSEEEYRSLIDDVFNTSMVGVIILDSSLTVVWCNEATEIYFGIQREEILGRDKRRLIDDKLKCVFADPDDYASRLLSAYDAHSFTDRFECHVTPGENREERWLEHWSQPIRSGLFSGGRIEQYTDITDRKMLEIAELDQRHFAEALSDIATLLTSTLDLREVLGRILTSLDRVVPHDSAAITMLEEDHAWVVRSHSDLKRDTQEIVAEKQLQIEYAFVLEKMLATQRPVIIHNLQDEPPVRETAVQANVRGYVGAPIRLQQRIIGFINVFSIRPDFFQENHSERLKAFAELSAIAIQNARLYQESHELAALKERERLARDLHDSVSQTLFTCRNIAESAIRRWNKDPDRVYELIEQLQQLTQTALSEMRILLLELRPETLTRVGLKQLFEQYLDPIQSRRGFKLNINIDDVPPLPPEVQIACYRIVQEALNNIDKHARATEVEITVYDHADYLELTVQDNGTGFAVAEVTSTSLGLNIMRERASEINASLSIESKVNTGTRITLTWPAREN